MRKKVDDSEYSKMTEQELYESAQKLLRLVEIVEKPESNRISDLIYSLSL
jgi:hypothetical protein